MAKKTKIETDDTYSGEVKKPKIFEMKANAKILLKPLEWAQSKGLNPVLFEVWKNSEPVTEEQFEIYMKQVM